MINRNKVQIFNGTEGIKKAYLEALSQESLDIICLADNYEQVLGSWFDEEYSTKLYKLPTREILPDNAENRAFAKAKDASKNAVKFLFGTASQSDVVIGKSMVILASYDVMEPLAIVISDSELVKGLSSQFEELWKGL